ncbi:MAG: FtsX-like permease family protein [Acidimicrobiia bacterium]|nr:FtsX-like permease family protein [Acidimicrobiia bacterium]
MTRNRSGGVLIVAEVAFALVLLAGAGLLVRSFHLLTRVDPGFNPAQVITVGVTLPASRYDSEDRMRTFAWVARVGGRFFDAMGITLVRGRFPGAEDTARSEPVFVIDETVARRYWPDSDPIGQRLAWDVDGPDTGPAGPGLAGDRLSGVVIGVAASVRWQGLHDDAPGTAYWWFPNAPGRDLTIVARTAGDPAALVDRIAAHVRAIDPHQPIGRARAMSELVADELARTRFTMLLLGGFAAAALLLAVVGLYGVVSFAASQRTREIGVRVALGAQRGDVIRLVLRHGVMLVAAGLAIGIAVSLAMGRAVEGLLYGVAPTDAPTLGAVVFVLAAVSVAATYLPARRAARIDPAVALRQE